jgi:LPXTG-motif cell wall-anchored protein
MTFITNNKPVYFINKLIVGEIYKFKEVTAPENYQKAKTITIKIKNTGDIQVISVEDKRSPGKITTDTPSGFPEGNNGSPHTGFDNALNFLIGTLMLSGAGIVWTLWRKKKLCK